MAKVKIQGHASGTGVLTVTAPNTSTDRTITLPDATGTLLSGAGGRRNIIINGAMNVAQRGTTFAAIADGAFSLDRWKLWSNVGAFTFTQDSDAPAGFANSLKIDCTTAESPPASGDYMELVQKIEGVDLQHLKKGTASAESITISFWVKSNKTGNIQVNAYDSDNTRIIGNTVTINSAATWEEKSLTFAGDTTGAITASGGGFRIEIWLDSGTSYSSGAVPTSWVATASAKHNAGGTLDLGDSTSNYLNITGVQLELGTAATDFEHRSYAEELALCKRYYQQYGVDNSVSFHRIIGSGNGGSVMLTGFLYPHEMRAAPTLNYYGANTDGGNFLNHVHDVTITVTAPNASAPSTQGVKWNFDGNGSYPNSCYWIDVGYGTNQFGWTQDAEL